VAARGELAGLIIIFDCTLLAVIRQPALAGLGWVSLGTSNPLFFQK
jgi:hypothetical protein